MKIQTIGTIGIIGGSILFLGLLSYLLLPDIINEQIKSQVKLEKGKLRRFIWDKPPFLLTEKFYLFNVSNPDAVMDGDKPILREIGPFVYDVMFENTNQIDNETDDTISFSQRYTYYFNPEKSKDLTGDEELVVPNFFILSSYNYVVRRMATAMPLFAKAVDSVFDKPTTLFLKAKARDILFDGLPIRCDASDFAGSAICGELKQRHKEFNIIRVNDTDYLLSLWGSMNGTDSMDRMSIHRGIQRIEDVGKVVAFRNHKVNMTVWGDPHCNRIEGTDGSIFPPFFDEEGRDPLAMFVPSMCRTFNYQFYSKSQYMSINTLRYIASIGIDVESNPDDKCYCTAPYGCSNKGTFDMYKCVKLPIMFSSPHFYQADSYYLNCVEGLKPEQEKHMTYMDIDPLTGSPLVFSWRVQFNMMLVNSDRFELMSKVSNTLLPLFWIEEEFATPDFMMIDLKMAHNVVSISVCIKLLMTIAGFGLCVYTIYLYYKTSYGSHNLVSKNVVKFVNNNTSRNIEKKSPIDLSTLHSSDLN